MESFLYAFLSPSSRPCLRLPSMASYLVSMAPASFNVVVEGAFTGSQALKTLNKLIACSGRACKKPPAPHGHPELGWSEQYTLQIYKKKTKQQKDWKNVCGK
ncbi:hypothetical protein TNCV_4512841 [Trichonephila clavipes]|nr:hypothetical protein TNCV_4512841 [Trichonephila clavipes]